MNVGFYLAEMPEISRFYGIVITINYLDHMPPHFHARYGGDRATVSIDRVLLSGSLPSRGLVLTGTNSTARSLAAGC